MKRRPGTALAIFFLAVFLGGLDASAWQRNGVLICDYPGNQSRPSMASDGCGGAIIVWGESRDVWPQLGDIYAQRVDRDGHIRWPSEGVAVCETLYHQSGSVLVSDGSGGAIIAWIDSRSAVDSDVYVQRMDSFGVARWPKNGVPICRGEGDQCDPQMTADRNGGAIISWIWPDPRIADNYDIWAQRVDSAGDVQWWPGGVPLTLAELAQWEPSTCTDGAGGAIITWTDYRDNWWADIYAQSVDSTGDVHWLTNGIPICDTTGDQLSSAIVSDGSGGAIVVWQDKRSGALSRHIYAQRVDGNGVAQWAPNGIIICDRTAYGPLIVSDGSGGAIVAWRDFRSDSWELYAQRVDADGQVRWAPNGVVICDTNGAPWLPDATSDGCGGAIVVWEDQRQDHGDIYAERVDSSGSVRWLVNGVAVCDTVGTQHDPEVVTDGAGGCIITWTDLRSGNESDIYAQRIDSSGSVGVGEEAKSRIPISRSQFLQSQPNPFVSHTTIRFILTRASEVELRVHDVAGREVAALLRKKLEAGHHSVVWTPEGLPSGIYFAKFTAGGFDVRRKLILIR